MLQSLRAACSLTFRARFNSYSEEKGGTTYGTYWAYDDYRRGYCDRDIRRRKEKLICC